MTGLAPSSGMPHTRTGMTLLEVVLATGLLLILMLAVYASMDQAYRLTTVGKDDMQRTQLSRALARMIELDLRCVTFKAMQDSKQVLPGVDIPTDPNNPDPTTTEPPTEPLEPALAGSLGLIGTATRMALHVSRPQRDTSAGATAADLAAAARKSDLRSVIYEFATAQGAAQVDANGKPLTGLIRTEGDRLSVIDVQASGGAGESMTVPHAIAEEVVSVLFRYFDGTTWTEEWDTSTLGQLPRAVEINLQFSPAAIIGSGLYTSAVTDATDTLRFVVALPAADPTGGVAP